MMTKSEVRALIRQRYHATTTAQRAQWAQAICSGLLADERLQQAHIVLAYYPLADEVDITPLLQHFLEHDKVVLLPQVMSATELVLRQFTGEIAIDKGLLGTTNATGEIFCDYDSISAALIPGVAFTMTGQRLGRGKGYYDRLLAHLPHTYKRAVYFPYQLVDTLPHEQHDIMMDYV